jgi:branched-chain amino acid transport system ATP-binding protein
MIEIKDLYVGYYRDLDILQGVSMKAEAAQIVTVLGANGVGKSTLLKAIYGFLKPRYGQILLDGKDITGIASHKLIKQGISYIPQHSSVFPNMSVEDNLKLGAWTFRGDNKRVQEKIEENYQRFPMLRERKKDDAGLLSGGMQRMVDPKVILVDEPTAGLAKMLSTEVYQMLKGLRDDDGLTIILVDQEIRQALKIADYVYVLELGRNKIDGYTQEFTDLKKTLWD